MVAAKLIRPGVMAELRLYLTSLATCSACCWWPWKTFRPVWSRLLSFAGRRNERPFERAIHRLVVGDFVRDVSLVKGGAVKFRELVPLGRCLFGQGTARVVVFGLDLQLFDQCKRLLVHLGVVAHHVVGKIAHFLALRFPQSLFCG